MKVIFMGTPKFAVRIVEELNKVHDIVLVVTQPDTYNIKKKEVIFNPVKKWAIENNIEVFQPVKIRNDFNKIINTECDIICTAAYGQLISEEVLNYPKYKCINVHGSVLPFYRGGAPIQRAIMNGEKETGVTIMYMVKKMDAGDILKVEKIPILETDNQETIFDKLSNLGAQMINGVIDDLVKGKIIPHKQDESLVTFAPNLSKDDELLDFNNNAVSIFNRIRGLNPNPGAYFILDNLPIKVYNSVVNETNAYNSLDVWKNGVIIGIGKDRFDISCNNHTVISILEIQLPSKNRMSVRDFLNGQGRKMIIINKEIK